MEFKEVQHRKSRCGTGSADTDTVMVFVAVVVYVVTLSSHYVHNDDNKNFYGVTAFVCLVTTT